MFEKKYDLAEKYLLKSIKEDSSDTASDYLTLSDLEQKAWKFRTSGKLSSKG